MGCGGLNLYLHKSSVQKPSNVALYFSVVGSDGAGVAGLKAESFRIYEDDRLISPYESKQTILNPEVAVAHYVLMLVDLSGSIVESGSLPTLISAATSFADRMERGQKIAIYGFDGSKGLLSIANFGIEPEFIPQALGRVANRRARDPSTNLNGAVVAAVDVLDRQLKQTKQPLRFGTLVVFTDGTDRAHRVSETALYQTLDEANLNVFAIGLGPEISLDQLQRLGSTGYVHAENAENLSRAFDEVAARIQAEGRKFYLLSYCSPARAGKHQLRIEAEKEGEKGSVSERFNADGFGPRCDPKRIPRFSAKRILMRNAKR